MVSYLLTIPACILIWMAEMVRGEEIAFARDLERLKKKFGEVETMCTRCGHKGKSKFINTQDE